MVPIMSLWGPILLSAVIVFLLSWAVHMLLPYHRSDYGKLPSEDEVLEALRKIELPPGEYMIPRPAGPQAMKDPAFIDKMKKGPVALLTVIPSGPPTMGASLAQWFVYCVLIGVVSAYVAGRALTPGAPYLSVFRFAGTTAFAGYALGLWQQSIWYKRPWSTTFKYTFDGLLYGMMTGGAFGWLWPK